MGEHQPHEHRALLGPGQIDRLPVDPRPDRAQHGDPHRGLIVRHHCEPTLLVGPSAYILCGVALTDRRELAAVFAGGALGTLARAALSHLLAVPPGHWPWATFIVNIAGAALLGYFTTRLLERLPVSAYRRPLLGTGLCGGLTTFSTMQVETIGMLEHGHYLLAAGYTVASVGLGLLTMQLSTALVRRAALR